MTNFPKGRLGAQPVAGGVAFSVWAPRPKRVEVRLLSGPRAGLHPLRAKGEGLWVGMVEGASAGEQYAFVLDGVDRPDPQSRLQPLGVHGPSEIVDPAAYVWRPTSFQPPAQADLILYELHVGTFTREGTFDAAAAELPALADLGVNTVELMPVAQFAGPRGWGYDGVDLFAPHTVYGGPDGLRRFVEAAHQANLAVVQDVVLNHLGPEGNYLAEFGPYFSERHTPWGQAFNLDSPGAAPVREYLLHVCLAWLDEYRMDGLRLDAVQALLDQSPVHLLRELVERVGDRAAFLIAESDQNDVRLIQPIPQGGYGLDAVWSDDFHHSVHAAITGERQGYYVDYNGLSDVAAAVQHGFVYEGQWSPFRGRPYGSLARLQPTDRFVIATQNHDQVGNRARGDRLATQVSPEADRLAATLLLLSPGIPLLFMGQEYGERRPFQYFSSHEDPALARATTEGRRAEFSAFAWNGPIPDPQSLATFEASKLDRSVLEQPLHRGLRRLVQDLLKLRRQQPALREIDRALISTDIDERRHVLRLLRGKPGERVLAFFSFSAEVEVWEGFIPETLWQPLFDSADGRYAGPGTTADRVRGGFGDLRLLPFQAKVFREAAI